MRVDQAPEGGKVRLTAAAALDGVAGAWGDGDMLSVALDGNGDLIASGIADSIGVIWTPEGRHNFTATAATYKNVIGGKKYTVFQRAEFVEANVGTSPALASGNKVYATTAGDVLTTGAVGARFLGFVSNDGRLIIDVGLLPNA